MCRSARKREDLAGSTILPRAALPLWSDRVPGRWGCMRGTEHRARPSPDLLPDQTLLGKRIATTAVNLARHES
ncbi:hypothetical protein E2C01_049239 [Portunus trituberculatus]|uniref:Uncharacterized protein n=1 Tax=Portunus trituberculatus TaxID=210409 RepID=A0A5B7GDC4_PORTR|nr:hypothetical protein [Portunus trituberculatus]